MNLSQHFKYDEFIKSDTAEQLKINNEPPESALPVARKLCETLLEPIRTQFGPLHINSGYRSPELNAAVKGSPTSDHIWSDYNSAVDFNCEVPLRQVFDWICQSGLEFDQCFLEYGKQQGDWRCIHISLREFSNRKQAGIKPTGGGGKIEWVEVESA